MIDKVTFENAEYVGQVDEYGMPSGRGSLRFSDGRVFTGELDSAAQRGRGIWRYPDGSCLRGGFTLCRDMPTWVYTDREGNTVSGIAYRFVSEVGEFNDAEADEVCITLCKLLSERGLDIEFNARALLIDSIMRNDRSVEDIVTALHSADGEFITVPRVMAVL